MSYQVRVSRRAGREIRKAATWWLENREKAPSAFADDLDDALHLLAHLPKVGEAVHHATISTARRLLLTRTQHHLYYSVSDSSKTVEVLVLWHASRGSAPRF